MDARTWTWRSVIIFAAALMLVTSAVDITVEARPLSDEEIEMHLKRLNKPAIKSIEFEEGVFFDCVDIYKQPAFDHPLLKDHKIIMSPSFVKKGNKKTNRSLQPTILTHSGQPSREACPEGTVPIRRVQKSDLIRASSLKNFGKRDAVPGQVERAGQTLFYRGPYIGAQANFIVYMVSVEPDEWSHSAVELTDGEDRENNNIILEAGWLANPGLFGSNYSHYYAYWTTDGYKSTGCYNLLCPGFVQIGDRPIIGTAVWVHSSYGGDPYGIEPTIHKDANNSVWWLSFDDHLVGYWPMSLFKKGSFESASTIRWVGSVLNTNKGGQHTTTQMGSGHPPTEGYGKSGFMCDLQVMKDANEGFYEPPTTLLTQFADKALCYDFKVDAVDDHFLYYGGYGRGDLCP